MFQMLIMIFILIFATMGLNGGTISYDTFYVLLMLVASSTFVARYVAGGKR